MQRAGIPKFTPKLNAARAILPAIAGVVASKVQGWIKVHIDGEEGVSNFHAADLKVVETTSVDSNAPWNEDASPLEKIASPSNKNASPKRKKSPIVKASAPSPAEVAAKSVAENSSISSTSFGTDLDPGLPPRHPTTLSSTEIVRADWRESFKAVLICGSFFLRSSSQYVVCVLSC